MKKPDNMDHYYNYWIGALLTFSSIRVHCFSQPVPRPVEGVDQINLNGFVTSQSSTLNGYESADRAVDGNTNGHYESSRSCTHTGNDYKTWWMVDMRTSTCVGEVMLYNRVNCCAERLLGAVVRVGDDDVLLNNPTCGEGVSAAQISAGQRITMSCNLVGQYISVHLPGVEYLTLCEVEAYRGAECNGWPLEISEEKCDGRNHISKHMCSGDKVLRLNCTADRVISIITALYGRKNATLCVGDPGGNDNVNTNCEAPNSLHVVRQNCDGRTSCNILSSKIGQFGNDPCPGTQKYLQVDYTCYDPGLATNPNISTSCPGGGWYFQDRCYWLIKEPTRTWTAANHYCSSGMGTGDLQLPTIMDNVTNDFIGNMLCEMGTESAWIGISDLQQDNTLRWLDGTFVNRTTAHWESSFDTTRHDSDGHCAFITASPHNEWSTESCTSARKGFICTQPYKPPVCPNGGTFFRDRCYWMGRQGSLMWHEAEQACQDEYGENVRLAVIKDEMVNSFLQRLVMGGAIWIGLKAECQISNAILTADSREWRWSDGSKLGAYSAWWDRSEPNNHGNGHDCASLATIGRWADVSCSEYYRYVCSLPPCVNELLPESDDGSGWWEPDNTTCSTTCNCVTDAACFHDGTCKCLPKFQDMVCDKADFRMSLTQPTAVTTGQNVTLTCRVNIPLADVNLRWTMAGKKAKKRLIGHLHPHKGTAELKLRNIKPKDLGIYSCIVTYTLGYQIIVDMKSAFLKDDQEMENETLVQGSGSSYKGMIIGVVVLAIICIVLLAIIIILKKRNKYV